PMLRIVTAFAFIWSSVAFSADLPKVYFNGQKDSPNFAGNCRAITQRLNTVVGYSATTCKATQGVVMIKMTPAVIANKQQPGVFALAFGASGWAVNEDYYGTGADFVVGNDEGGQGCLRLNGGVAAHFQDRI